jgi:hypothetical protein
MSLKRFGPGWMGIGVLVWCLTPGFSEAQPAVPVIPSPDTVVEDACSPAYRAVEQDALQLWEGGQRETARGLIQHEIDTAPPADAAAARLRLGYMHLSDKNTSEAATLFEALNALDAGINDPVRAEAAERLAYLALREKNHALCRSRFQSLVSGDYSLTHEKAIDICLRLGSLERRVKDYQAGLSWFEAAADAAVDPSQRAHAQTGMAGLWLDLANGDGDPPLDEEDRPPAYDEARALCLTVIEGDDPATQTLAPLDRQMLAELMYFESFYFQRDYTTAYYLGAAFLARWAEAPEVPQDYYMTIYLNTARTFHAMNAYLTDHYTESLELSTALVEDPPSINERFRHFNALMYGAVCGRLACEALDCGDEADWFEQAGMEHNAAHYQLLRPTIIGRHGEFVARTGGPSARRDVAQSLSNK